MGPSIPIKIGNRNLKCHLYKAAPSYGRGKAKKKEKILTTTVALFTEVDATSETQASVSSNQQLKQHFLLLESYLFFSFGNCA